MDGIGQGQVIDLLSKTCRNESFTDDGVAAGNLPRHNAIPLLENYQKGPEVDPMIVSPPKEPSSAPAASHWAYFDFHASSLSALKSKAVEMVKSGYMRRRPHCLCLAISLSCPRVVFIPRRINQIRTSCRRTVLSWRLSKVPWYYAQRDLQLSFTQLDRSPEKRAFSFAGKLRLDKDLMLSSWAKLDLYEQDFGLGLGKPESVRRPRFTPAEGLTYLLPKSREGSVALANFLSDDDVNKLKEDDEWVNYTKYIG
ncbi:hypothetical protein LY76DRAFT_655381 [Colletotrichum caudatum]|nr:hypothetical protein LY76DRAFT_655381 [Colletotrichum caudatum]